MAPVTTTKTKKKKTMTTMTTMMMTTNVVKIVTFFANPSPATGMILTNNYKRIQVIT